MPVTVQFTVRAGHDLFLTEAELSSSANRLAGQDYLYGRLLLSVPDGMAVFVEDELIPLIANLCFLAPTQLSAGQAFGAYINRYPGEFFLEVIGADTRLYGSSVFTPAGQPDAELIAPTTEFLPSLHACGRRALAFIHRELGADPAHAEALAALDALNRETTVAVRT